MSFKNLKSEAKEKITFLETTSDQKKRFIDEYIKSGNPQTLKHALKADFKGNFKDALEEGILMMKQAEEYCASLMISGKPPTSLTSLRSTFNKAEPDMANTVIDYLVGKIVGATGTFKEYQECFKTEKAEV